MAEEKKVTKEAEEQETAVVAVESEVMDEGNIIRLTQPVNGRNELVFNFDKIKGATLLKCEKKAKEVDASIVVPQLSMVFQAHVAAAAVGARYDDIINLPGPDFMAVTMRVSRFLNNAG
jgi:hypothetical protein